MNSYFAWTVPAGSLNSNIRWTFNKSSDLAAADPSRLFLFLDVAPASICHSAFVVVMGDIYYYHRPSAEHVGSGVLSFADGHVEAHRWKDAQTTDRSLDDEGSHFVSPRPGNQDLKWLQDRASVLK